MKIFQMKLLLLMTLAASSVAVAAAESPQEKARAAVKRLEQFISQAGKNSTASGYTVKTAAAAAASASKPSQSIQEKLKEEHEKSKDKTENNRGINGPNGYHREFHDAVKQYGGERLQQEWKKYCTPSSIQKAELNC